MERHYLAQTAGTGTVFTFFLLATIWVMYPDKIHEFIKWITAYEGQSSNYLILAFGAVQPVIGIIIDSVTLPFCKRFHCDDDARLLLQAAYRLNRNCYKETIDQIEQDAQSAIILSH